MNQHQQIMEELEKHYEALGGAVLIAPSALAVKVYEHFRGRKSVDPHIQYTSLEHMKSMARTFLRKRNDPTEAKDGEVEQSAFEFSKELQPRYPIPHKRGEEPQYKLREHLTPEERAWNVERLRRAAKTFGEHADALEAEGRSMAVA